MRILITGGTGFIGKTLIGGLSKEHKIFSPTHKKLELLDAESVNKYIEKNKIEVIIHCAVKGGPDVLPETVSIFANLIRNTEKINKIIYFGSGAEYSKYRNLIKVKESEIGKIIPSDDFGLSKFICNEISKNNKKIINLRIFGIFGENENYLNAFISNSIVKNLLNQSIKINQNVKFDYLFANDLIPVVKYFLKHSAKYSHYNVTPDRSITLEKIAKIINKISDKPAEIKTLHGGMNFTYTGNNKRLKKEIKKLKFTDYDEGIKKLFDYHKKNIVKLNKTAIIQDQYLARLKINETSRKLSK